MKNKQLLMILVMLLMTSFAFSQPHNSERVKFTSTPVKTGSINTAYSYTAVAKSSDSTAVLNYFKATGPTGMAVDSVTGAVTWTPAYGGRFYVNLTAKSNKGGRANQSFYIEVTSTKGVLKGIVKADDTTNANLGGVYVYFLMSDGLIWDYTVTNNTGAFSKSLSAGVYKIKYAKQGYVTEYFDNKATFELGNSVTVAGGDTQLVSAAIAKVPPPVYYTITGSVLNTDGQPIRGKVSAMFSATNATPTPDNRCSNHVSIDSLGNYTLRLVGGKEYIVFVAPADKKYVPEYWDNKKEFTLADKILLDANKTNINFVIELKPVYANGISGQVKHFYGDMEGVFANVTAYKLGATRTVFSKSVLTDSLGVYSLQNLEPGNYVLRALPKRPYLPGYYKLNGIAFDWRKADTLVITETSTLTNVVINLKSKTDTGVAIANGKVVLNNMEQAVLGSLVYVKNSSGDVVGYGISNNDGSYSIDGLTNGTYTLSADIIDHDNVTNPTITIDENINVYNTDISITPFSPTAVENEVELSTPSKFELSQNYPNPFNPSTTIKFSLTEKAFASIKIYNILGKEVASLVNEVKDAGNYSITFNASQFVSGVYFYKLESGKTTITKKMILMK